MCCCIGPQEKCERKDGNYYLRLGKGLLLQCRAVDDGDAHNARSERSLDRFVESKAMRIGCASLFTWMEFQLFKCWTAALNCDERAPGTWQRHKLGPGLKVASACAMS